MSPRRILLTLVALSALLPATGFAHAHGFFAGLDASGGITHGSSSTRDGGWPPAGGGIVSDVKFKHTAGIGGHVGYHFDSRWSVFLSYRYTRSDISWKATYPDLDEASLFDGKASSNTILANVGYDIPLANALVLSATAGVGVAYNSLHDVVETDAYDSSPFLSDVEDHDHTSTAAQLGVGLRYAATPRTTISLDFAATYQGGFRTGDTRSGNLGVTPINPYKIDDVWRMSLGASVVTRF